MTRGVLVVGTFSSAGGTHRTYCEDLSDRLESHAWTVTRTSSHASRARRVADMLATTVAARRRYQVAHIDVFSHNGFWWAEAVCFALRRLGKPYVLTLRGGNLPEFAARWPRRVARLLESAAAVTAPSGFLRDAMQPYHRDIVVLPNAVEVARYSTSRPQRPRTRLVWLRAFHRVYNPVMAVDVLAALARTRSDVTLTMIGGDKGDGSLDAVKARADHLGVASRLEIQLGVPKDRVPACLEAGDVFVNTTDADNTPVSVIEAMASGLCVVSTDVGGIRYLLRDGDNALLVPPRDATAMASAVTRIIAEPALAERVAAAARRDAETFDWTRVLADWERVLEGALDA